MVCDAVPDREAVVAGERRFTYRTLDERANRLAHHLASAGIGRGHHVGLQLLNGTEYVEGMLACFKIRAVPINVNYRYVEDELRHLFTDGDIVVNITNERFADRVVEARTPALEHVIVVERDYESALAASSGARDFGSRSPD